MSKTYFGKRIEVTTRGLVRQSASFRLDDKWHLVEEVVFSWKDTGFGNVPRTRPPRWWRRHHRNYYRVRTTDGDTYEIYYDRGTSLNNPRYRRWYVTRQL